MRRLAVPCFWWHFPQFAQNVLSLRARSSQDHQQSSRSIIHYYPACVAEFVLALSFLVLLLGRSLWLDCFRVRLLEAIAALTCCAPERAVHGFLQPRSSRHFACRHDHRHNPARAGYCDGVGGHHGASAFGCGSGDSHWRCDGNSRLCTERWNWGWEPPRHSVCFCLLCPLLPAPRDS